MPDYPLYMQRCIELARLGAGSVSPNPMVGAVVVCDDKIIGEGYHERYGKAHAEVNAINAVLKNHADAEALLKKSTIYVSLEPCAHFGKTPPCADLIIRHGLPRVVVGCRDPFDAVDARLNEEVGQGKGIEKLRNTGVEVITDVMKAECENLNKRFFTSIKKQRPYIILKWAQTADGFFAPADGSKKWITSPLAKKLVHKWRSEEDAVLVGKNTALADDPQLNVREWKGRNPKRIVIDRNLELPQSLHLFDQSVETIVFNAVKTDAEGVTKYIALEDFDHYLPQLICYQLYLMDVQSLIIEGGAKTLELFIHAGLWDEARIFTAPVRWGDGIQAPIVQGAISETSQVADDTFHLIYNT